MTIVSGALTKTDNTHQPESDWYVNHDGQHFGPVTFHDLQRLASKGLLSKEQLLATRFRNMVVSRKYRIIIFFGRFASSLAEGIRKTARINSTC
jgi:hypothetical protein